MDFEGLGFGSETRQDPEKKSARLQYFWSGFWVWDVWHISNSHGHIPALAFRQKSVKIIQGVVEVWGLGCMARIRQGPPAIFLVNVVGFGI